MMKTFILASLSGLLCLSQVISAATQPVPPSGICTRDVNAFGFPSSCECSEISYYSPASGYCLEQKPEFIQVHGILHAGLMAIGGETTGVEIETQKGTFELILAEELLEFTDEINGYYVDIVGEYIELEGVISGLRPTIIVESIFLLD